DIDDDGTVQIAHMDAAGAEAAKAKVEALTEEVRVGKVYEGKVTSIKEFGAFIEILPGRDGLCHISELDDKYVGKVEDVCKVGDKLRLKVIAMDAQARVKLSGRPRLGEQTRGRGGRGAGGGPPPRPREGPPRRQGGEPGGRRHHEHREGEARGPADD